MDCATKEEELELDTLYEEGAAILGRNEWLQTTSSNFLEFTAHLRRAVEFEWPKPWLEARRKYSIVLRSEIIKGPARKF